MAVEDNINVLGIQTNLDTDLLSNNNLGSFNDETDDHSDNGQANADESFNTDDHSDHYSGNEEAFNTDSYNDLYSNNENSFNDHSVNAGIRQYNSGSEFNLFNANDFGAGKSWGGGGGDIDIEVDNRQTNLDQSVNQNIWADGDVEQWFDNDSVVASGDRAVAGLRAARGRPVVRAQPE